MTRKNPFAAYKYWRNHQFNRKNSLILALKHGCPEIPT